MTEEELVKSKEADALFESEQGSPYKNETISFKVPTRNPIET